VATDAIEQSGIPAKFYVSAFGRSMFDRMQVALAESGVEIPDFQFDDATREVLDGVERRITTRIDAQAFVELKQKALAAHASQIAESFFSQIPDNAFKIGFGVESFIRVRDTTNAPTPEDDLFAGLRD